MPRLPPSRLRAAVIALVVAVAVTGCSTNRPDAGPVPLRLGYFGHVHYLADRGASPP